MHEFRDKKKKKNTINIEIYPNNAAWDITQFDNITLYKFNIY